jgi:cytochrome c556
MKKTILTVLAISATCISFSAAAQFAKPEDAVKYRKAALTVTAAHFSRLGETKAKPEIWKQTAKFKEAAEKFQVESAKLAAAAKTGKEDAFKTAFSATAGTCKACHDDFRAK